jgi:hypothetical protein
VPLISEAVAKDPRYGIMEATILIGMIPRCRPGIIILVFPPLLLLLRTTEPVMFYDISERYIVSR